MARRVGLVLAVALGLLAGGGVAPAQGQAQKAEVYALYQRAAKLTSAGKLREAAEVYEQAVAKARAALGPQHPDTATLMNGLALVYREMGQYAKAEPLVKRSLEVYEARLGKDHLFVAAALNNLAALYHATAQYVLAEPLYQRSLAIREAKLGKGHPDVAQSLSNLGVLYRAMGRYARAEPLYQRSLAIREARLGKDHPDVAQTLNNLAGLYRAMARHAQAEPLFKRSLAIYEARLGKDHPELAHPLNNLAGLYQDMGQYAQAESLYQRSLKIREVRLGKDHPDVAQSLNNLANLYLDTGRYARAESLYQRCLGTNEARLGEDHPDVATSLNNLARLYQTVGQPARAEPLLQRSLGIRRARLGEDHPDVATSLNNLGSLYQDMGQLARARPLYQRSLELREGKWGKDHPEVANSLNNLAMLYQDMGQYARAEPLLERSLAILEAKLGRDHPSFAQALNNLALLYLATGRHARAEALYQRCLEIEEARLGKDHPRVATTLHNLAVLHHAAGRHARAEALYQRCLEIREARLGKDHPDVATCLNGLAGVCEAVGRPAQAERLTDRSRRILRRHAGSVLPALSPPEQASFLRNVAEVPFHAALSLGLRGKGRPGRAALSASWLANGKGAAQEALAQSALLLRGSADPALARRLGQLQELRRQLARLTFAAPGTDAEARERHQRLEELSDQEQELARQLRQEGVAGLVASWVELADVRKALPKGGVLIDVARFPVYNFKPGKGERRWGAARYVAWVTPHTGDVRVIDLGDAARIDTAVQAVRKALDRAAALVRQKGEPEAEKALRVPLGELSRLVLRPLLPAIGRAERWVASPDGALWLVPWQALLLPDGRYAVERHRISYATSGRALLPRPAAKVKPAAPLVLADPDFDRAGAAASAAPEGTTLRSLPRSLRLGAIPRLPGTAAEARAVAPSLRRLTGQEPAVYTRRQAAKAALRRHPHPRVLLLATHGFFLPAQQQKLPQRPDFRGEDMKRPPPGWENPLVRCGLLLAGCNGAAQARAGSDDGVLTGLEVLGLDLRGTELVVLSACETGLGEVQTGEGVAGLRQAFQMAGARAVLSSLWGVPDRSSAELMSLFFARLARGEDRAEALRQAQLALIAQRREDFAVAHPLFWAAFALTGGAGR